MSSQWLRLIEKVAVWIGVEMNGVEQARRMMVLWGRSLVGRVADGPPSQTWLRRRLVHCLEGRSGNLHSSLLCLEGTILDTCWCMPSMDDRSPGRHDEAGAAVGCPLHRGSVRKQLLLLQVNR